MLGGGGTPAGARGDIEGRVQVGAGWVGGHRGAPGARHSTGHVVPPGAAEPLWAHRALAAGDAGLGLASAVL